MENKTPDSETPAKEEKQNNTLTIVLVVALILALLAVVFLLIAYVFGGDDESEGEAPPPTVEVPPTVEQPADIPLEGTAWILAGTIEGSTISLTFAGDSLSGSAGCNEYNATYLTTMAAGSSNSIQVGPISSTQVLCDEPIMNQEQAYLANLQAATGYAISGNTLTLSTAGATLTFGAAQATQ